MRSLPNLSRVQVRDHFTFSFNMRLPRHLAETLFIYPKNSFCALQ